MRVIKYALVYILEWLGFVHWHRWSLQGPRERLNFLDPEKGNFIGLDMQDVYLTLCLGPLH